ncbi:MAG: magnesium transporter [Atopostipes suicloacalis]|nr:magnesium transporter [Atopostipes suicloacalis]MDN6731532.1 magnesium transporter [Atopostipes suicloacalis]
MQERYEEEQFELLFEAVNNNRREEFRELFLPLHERDQLNLFHLLYPKNKKKISVFLSPEEFAEIFEWMDAQDQKDAVKYLPKKYILSVFNDLPSDILANFVYLNSNADTNIQAILKKMDSEKYKRVEELLSYEQETAGSIMTKEYLFIYENDTSEEVIERVRYYAEKVETIYYLYVVDRDHHLVGVLSLRDLLLAPKNKPVHETMNTLVLSVPVDMDQEDVSDLIQEYDLIAMPVVSHDERLVGIITVDDIIDVMEYESDEDFSDFAGVSYSSAERESMTPMQAAKQRSPWIILLLFLSLFTGGLISRFEETLAAVVSLAAFIPLIMDSSGNVGTQSLAVAIRNMENDEKDSPSLLKTLRNEAEIGGVIGMFSGIAIFILISLLYQNVVLAFVVGVSISLSIVVSAVVGTLIPVLITKLNFDPAVASGPFITTINDMSGLVIYLGVATLLLEYLQ